eukprot:TRINITY_DN5199_c0_g2_i1.p1 TRINITY_DN5199_c0_g2~~TRINITY_DN5199_c0_g2_i1.p1  ORF type:complete len:205 (-),score=26.08 TRINITY_DN5199_c0_g2_i1:80-694(-)
MAEPVDPTQISFKDPQWLQAFPLNNLSVLDYFALSSFYDRTCNNEQLKMQRLSLDNLRDMRGIEYVLKAEQDPFVILKQERSSPTEVTILAVYYIIAGTIYQSPDLKSVFASRMARCIHRVNSAFVELNRRAVHVSGTGGQYLWNVDTKKDSDEALADMWEQDRETSLNKQDQREHGMVDRSIRRVMASTMTDDGSSTQTKADE